MRVDRRDFLRIGGASALFALGCDRSQPPADNPSGSQPTTAAPPTASGGPGNGLQVTLTGLVLLEKLGNTAAVHLVDGEAITLGQHVPQMWVPSAAIDANATKKPDDLHVVQLGDTEFWVWDLAGTKVTGPSPSSGQPDLTFDETDVGSAQKPANDQEWKSLAWVPDLRTLSGATKIVNRNALTSTITLNHGHLESRRPTGVGPFAVWRFTNPAGQVVMRRALTNQLVYTYSTAGQTTKISVGDRDIVFVPNANARIAVRNLPPENSPHPGCPSPCTPNINHFVAFFKLVDAQYTPKGELDSFTPPQGMDIEPDYCPPGRI